MPLALTILYLVSQFTMGINFGFTAILKRNYRPIAQKNSVFISLVMMGIITGPIVFMYDDIWVWFNAVKFILFFFILNNLHYNMFNLIVDINDVCEVTRSEIKVLSLIAIGYTILLDTIKIFFMIIRCAFEVNPYCGKFISISFYILYFLPVISLDVIGVSQTLIYYYLKCGVKNNKICLKSSKDINLKYIEVQYIAIADIYGKIRPLYDYMIILQLGITVPKLMATLWSLLLYLRANAHWYTYMTEITFAIHLVIQICGPAIAVEMANYEVDEIKQTLKDKILFETDDRKITELRHTLQVVKTKPLRHLVLRFIPIDVSLLLSLFSLCTSYFIVLIQFSHIID